MTTSGLADADRIEVSTLEEDVGGRLRDTRVLSAKHTCDTHRLLGIADHEVGSREGALYAIEGDEFLSLGSVLDDDLVAFDLVGVERVECLSHLVEHEVGDIHHVVDRANADSA